ncbi:MAG: NRDE family protein [Myxococcales bacterium]|nr:NRDE family protein [Myxococcales bacterium]
MCTLVAYSRVHPQAGLIIAANRDEFVHRPSAPPAVLEAGAEVLLGGRDLEAGGTWLGVTRRGFFVGLTNQRTPLGRAGPWRSRGEVVLAVLRQGSTAAAAAYLRALDPRHYRPFNLFFGDAEALSVAYLRPEPARCTLHALGPGQHVLANDVMGSAAFPKTELPVEWMPPSRLAALTLPEASAALAQMMGRHDHPRPERLPPREPWVDPSLADNLQSLCVHVGAFATVSSTLLALAPGRVLHYAYAAGPPCVTPFAPYDALV